MFCNGTQRKFWIFESQDELKKLRESARQKFLSRHPNEPQGKFLSSEEETVLCQLVEETAQKFCESFEPPMPPSVVNRGYQLISVLETVIMISDCYADAVTVHVMACLYLACKVDEFNVNIDEFVKNLKSGTVQSNTEVILGLEADLMRLLKFHLTIHGPYRPLEGHLIEIKTKYPQISRPESMRKSCEEFLWKSLLTDVCFLYPPSQIALAALFHSANILGYDFKNYIRSVLCDGDNERADVLISKLSDCMKIVQAVKPVKPKTATALQEKVKQCMIILAQKQSNKRKSEGPADAHESTKRVKSNEDSDFDD